MLQKIKYELKLLFFKKRFRNMNKQNEVYPKNLFPLNKVKIGKYSYGPLRVYSWNAENEFLQIGNFVSIAEGVKFVLGGNHYYKTFSTYPFKVKFLGYEREAWSKGPIIIEDDVWIGMDAMIMSGVRIGKGAIIGSRCVVTKDIPPYSIAVGNPAKIVKYRFDDNTISKLIDIDLVELLDYEFVKENIDSLYDTFDYNNIKQYERR